LDHYNKYCPHREEVKNKLKGTSQPVVLTNPFPTQQQKIIAQNPTPPQGSNVGHPHHGDVSSSTQVFVCKETISLMNRPKTYDTPPDGNANGNGGALDKPSTSTTPPPSLPLQIVLHPPKSIIQKSVFKPSAHASQNYNIVEDLA